MYIGIYNKHTTVMIHRATHNGYFNPVRLTKQVCYLLMEKLFTKKEKKNRINREQALGSYINIKNVHLKR